MALTLNCNLESKISFNERDTQESYRSITNAGEIKYTGQLSHGTGQRQANTLYTDVRTIPSGDGQETLDLFNLQKNVFGSEIDISFSGGVVKGIIIRNTQSVAGRDLAVVTTGTNHFTGPFGSTTGLQIPAESCLNQSNILNGWRVDTDQRYIQVKDLSNQGGSYQILLVGVTN